MFMTEQKSLLNLPNDCWAILVWIRQAFPLIVHTRRTEQRSVETPKQLRELETRREVG